MKLRMTLECVDHTTEVPELKRDLDSLDLGDPVSVKIKGKLWLCRLLDYEEK